MNVNSGEGHPKFELPPVSTGYERVQEQARETDVKEESAGLSKSPAVDDTFAAPSIQTMPVAAVNTSDASDDSNSRAVTDTASAEDNDRIEKEWVDRAKTIISSTRADPFEQKSQLSRIKADYIKKRFNKTIPTDDTVPA